MTSFIRDLAGALPSNVPMEGAFGLLLNAGGALLRILLTLAVAFAFAKVANSLIDRLIAQRTTEERQFIDERKAKTLRSVLRSIVRYVIYAFAAIAILRELGVDATGLLAGAGLAGLALGFGAQSLVRDIINGFFILFEDHFAVGDYVTIGDISGIIEAVGLRATRVRGFGGELHIIPNGQIDKVTNHMGSAMRVSFSVIVDYKADIDHVIDALTRDFEKAREEIPGIIEGPAVLGVKDLADSGVELLILARAKPMQQWQVERDLKKRVKSVFDREGIAIPYRHIQVLIDKQ